MDEVKLSRALADPIDRLYKTGGLQLVFMFVGTLLLIVSVVPELDKYLRYSLAFIGASFLMLTMAFFFITHIKPINKVRKEIEKDAVLINTVQTTALELVETADMLQDLAFTHANSIASVLKQFGPKIKQIPLIGNAAAQPIEKSENLAIEIIKLSTNTKDVITEIEKALRASDASALKVYLEDLRLLRIKISEIRIE